MSIARSLRRVSRALKSRWSDLARTGRSSAFARVRLDAGPCAALGAQPDAGFGELPAGLCKVVKAELPEQAQRAHSRLAATDHAETLSWDALDRQGHKATITLFLRHREGRDHGNPESQRRCALDQFGI